jgi:hypothetical protein
MKIVSYQKSARIPMAMIRLNLLFSLFYWVMESVRDVIIFNKGNIAERIFRPDPMSFWMRILVIFIFLLFSVYSSSLREKIEVRGVKVSKFMDHYGILWAGIAFAVLYWLLETFRDVFVFHKGEFLHRLVMPDAMGFWMRIMVIFMLLLFSSYVQSLVNRHRKMEQDLKTAHAELEQQVKNSGMELSRSNEILMQQVSLREKTEKVLQQMNSSLAMLSACNEVLNRGDDEKKMLNEICGTIVAVGNYPLAWVCAVGRDGKEEMFPTAQCVTHSVDIKLVQMTTAAFSDDQNPLGQAARSGRPGLVRNLSKLDEKKLWAETAWKCRYASLLSLPLKNKTAVFAILSIYAADSSAFDDEQLGLLEQLADNLSFGIVASRSRQPGRIAEKMEAA